MMQFVYLIYQKISCNLRSYHFHVRVNINLNLTHHIIDDINLVSVQLYNKVGCKKVNHAETNILQRPLALQYLFRMQKHAIDKKVNHNQLLIQDK